MANAMRRSFQALFVRGGTSNGLMIHRHHLPPQDQWHTILPLAMGSPDSTGRQLNGMGSGVSSTSKICVLSPSSRHDADVDYTFVQVGVKDGSLDMAGNCGNMSSAVGPVALDEGLVQNPKTEVDRGSGSQMALVRIFNTNTAKLVHSRFKVTGSPLRYCPNGNYEMDGVPAKSSRIILSFLDPAGAKTGQALPTGHAIDVLTLPDGSSVEASLVDVSNPGVFVRVRDLGMVGDAPRSLNPVVVEANAALKARLEQIRKAGAVRMGLNPSVQSVPKIVLILDPPAKNGITIQCLALSMGQAHKAVPLTLALCLGAAVKLPGTIPNLLASAAGTRDEAVVIGHPSGKVDIGMTSQDGRVVSAELHRTARVLMKGEVFY